MIAMMSVKGASYENLGAIGDLSLSLHDASSFRVSSCLINPASVTAR